MRGQVFSSDLVASLALFFVMLGIAYYAIDSLSYRYSASAAYSLLEREAYHAINMIYHNTSSDSVFNRDRLVLLFNSTNLTGEYNIWSGYELSVTDGLGNVVQVSGVVLNKTNGLPAREGSPTVTSERKGVLEGETVTMRLRVWY